MRLSEAIRLGATMRPQVKYGYQTREGSCVLGAAADAIGLNINEHDDWYSKIIEAFPILKNKYDCVGGKHLYAGSLMSEIVGLNDDLGWTREQIADWVELNYESNTLPDIPSPEIEVEIANELESVSH